MLLGEYGDDSEGSSSHSAGYALIDPQTPAEIVVTDEDGHPCPPLCLQYSGSRAFYFPTITELLSSSQVALARSTTSPADPPRSI